MSLSPFPRFTLPTLTRRALPAGEIHLFCAHLAPPEFRVQELERVLDAEEVERANRFRFPHLRRRFVVARGLLRTLLAAYTAARPEDLVFTYGDKGKPFLNEPRTSLQFNLSHSEEMALLGICGEHELGVDIEWLRPMPDALSIAQHFFSANEILDLKTVPTAQIAPAFFNCWTRKEAYIKAVGDGLSAPLDRFDVTLIPGQPARMRSLEGDPEKGSAWALYHFEPAQGYVGALAVLHHHWQISAWNLDVAHLRWGEN